MNTLIRISALHVIRKLFSNRLVYKLSITLICLSILYGGATILSALLICRPIRASWDTNIPGRCGNQTVAYVSLEVVGLAIDIAILVLPWPLTMNLQLDRKKKLVILFIMSAGGL